MLTPSDLLVKVIVFHRGRVVVFNSGYDEF